MHQRHVKVAQCDLQSCMNNISLASKRLAHCRRGVHDLRKSMKNTDKPTFHCPVTSIIVSPPQPARAFPSIGYLPHTQVCCEEKKPTANLGSTTITPKKPTMPKPKRNIQIVAEETWTPPASLTANQKIARVKIAAGNHLYHLELPSGEALLAELDAKFRSTIWMKRGGYVLLDTEALAERGNKLAGIIVNIVGDEKAWRKMPYWPKEFAAKQSSYAEDSDDEDDQGPQMPPSDSEDED